MEWLTWSLCFYVIIGWGVVAAIIAYACCIAAGRADDINGSR